ncbi:hypothetical protein E4U48_007108 [Claviceps purpurea]|nr:hypothetical protein E4U48_007108 [Claviceps purpurea]
MGTVLQDDDPLPPDEIDAIRTQTTTAQSMALEELWPLIEVTLSRMSKAKIFTNVDVRQAFHLTRYVSFQYLWDVQRRCHNEVSESLPR